MWLSIVRYTFCRTIIVIFIIVSNIVLFIFYIGTKVVASEKCWSKKKRKKEKQWKNFFSCYKTHNIKNWCFHSISFYMLWKNLILRWRCSRFTSVVVARLYPILSNKKSNITTFACARHNPIVCDFLLHLFIITWKMCV